MIDDGDGSQLVKDERVNKLGIKINILVDQPICSTCGIVLINWKRHMTHSHHMRISKDDEASVNVAIRTARADPPQVPPGTFIQGVRSKPAWQCDYPNCGIVCGTDFTKRYHCYTVQHPRSTWTAVTAQRPTQTDPLIKVLVAL